MILNAYSIRDKFSCFGTPFFVENDFVAIRNFRFLVMNHETAVGLAPADFDLYNLGSFNSDTGQLVPLDVPVSLISGTEALNMVLSEKE